MKKLIQIFALAGAAATVLALTSCGCTSGEASAPPLRKLPDFNELPTIDYADEK
tara:strand:- start:77 stop:238 length:162 start_codon:yes stop_codon:yes gene_type:complete